MRKEMVIISATLMAACSGGERGAKSVPPIDTANFDTSVALNEDFYGHVNGGWIKNNPLRPEYARYGVFDVLNERNEERIKELFVSLSKRRNPQGSVAQKIADLYNLGLDSTRLNDEGAKPIEQALDRINAVKDVKALSAVVGEMHLSVANPFFSASVDADLMNSSDNMFYVNQSGLGMGTRDYYIEESSAPLRDSYRQYIATIMSLAGYDEQEAQRVVESVMNIEMSLAEASYSNVELRDVYKNYNVLSSNEVTGRFPAIDWQAYFDALGLAMPEKMSINQLPAMERVNELLEKQSLQTLKDYLAFHSVNSAAGALSDDFQNARFEFFGKTLSGKLEQQPRWKRALSVPNSVLSEAVGEMYVEKYFSPESKEKMLGIVGNLKTALGKHIDALDWMSEPTKAKAREKLAAFTVKIGYPDKWKDYSSLEIDPSLSYWENLVRASEWHTRDMLADIGKPVDKSRWFMSPQTVNAYYNPTSNEICFPAAILQPPFFNPDADDAVNYGAIGVVIGHEMTHGFDDQGRQFDKDGNLVDWWQKEDADAFNGKADQLAAQFDAIEVLDGVHANGKLTTGENIADQGGLRVAYTAYADAMGGVMPEPVDGFTAEQRFYISYATVWAQSIRDEEIERLTKVDPHSLGKWRVDATLRNVDTFFKAFGITDGAMYLEPEQRVVIW